MSSGRNPPVNPPVDLEDGWKRIAASRLGLSSSRMSWFFHNAAARGSNGLTANGGGTGGESTVAGAYKMATGATGGSFRRVYAFSNGTDASKMCRNGQNWWIAGRFKLSSAVAASTQLGVGLASAGTNFVANVGARAATSTTNFVLSAAAGTAIDSGQALDSSYHDHEGYRVSSLTRYLIDGVLKGTGDPNIDQDCGPFSMVFNTGDAVDRIIELVWFAAAAPGV